MQYILTYFLDENSQSMAWQCNPNFRQAWLLCYHLAFVYCAASDLMFGFVAGLSCYPISYSKLLPLYFITLVYSGSGLCCWRFRFERC